MALFQCPECGHQISDRAKHCPNCGYVLTSSHKQHQGRIKRWLGISAIIVAVLVIALCVLYFFTRHSDTTHNIAPTTEDGLELCEDYTPIISQSFCYFDAEYEIVDIKKVSQLVQSLEELKFQKTSETESEIDFATDDSYTDIRKIKNYTYERGEGQNYIKVKINGIDSENDIISGGFIEIVFSNKGFVNEFLTDAERNNFSKVSSTSYHSPKYDTVFWTGADLEVDGNTIIIRKRANGE